MLPVTKLGLLVRGRGVEHKMGPAVEARGYDIPIDRFAVSIMLVLTFSWGLNQVAVKVSNTGYDPVFAVVVRSTIGALLVYGWCVYRGIKLFDKDGTLGAGLLSGVLFSVEFFLIYTGLDYTTAARGALMGNTMPFWVLLGAYLYLGECISGRKVVGLGLAFFGVILVLSDNLSVPSLVALWGDVMCLCAGAIWATNILVIRTTRLRSASAEKILLYQLVVSAVLVAPLVPLGGPITREITTLATVSLVFQSVFIVAFTYVLWFWLMRRYPVSGLSSFAFLTPTFGVLCAGVLLGEPLSWQILSAQVVIAVGLVIVNRPREGH